MSSNWSLKEVIPGPDREKNNVKPKDLDKIIEY